MYVNGKSLGTPWPIGLGMLFITFCFGLPGYLNPTKDDPDVLAQQSKKSSTWKALLRKFQTPLAIVTLLRCCGLGISAIIAIRGPPPYPLLSDSIYPLGLSAWLYWTRTAERKKYPALLIGLAIAMGLLGAPSLYLAYLEFRKGNTCMYTYMPNDQCLSPDLCDMLSLPSNFSCAAWPPSPSYVCSAGEVTKGFFGMIGAICMTLVFLVLVEQTFHVLVLKRKPAAGSRLVRITFLMGMAFGVVSLGIGYFGTSTPTAVHIGDCRNHISWQGDCGPCVSMLSPTSKNGYLDAWTATVKSDWLTIVALG